MRKPIRGSVPVAITDEQIMALRELYEKIRQIPPGHAYSMLCLADTTEEERRFFSAVGDINTYGRPFTEELAELEEVAKSLDAEVLSGLRKNLNFVHEDMLELQKRWTDPFCSKSNMEFLLRGKAALDTGEGVEHELLEDEPQAGAIWDEESQRYI